MKSLSRTRLLATPWTAAYQASLSMGFSRQEYWSGVPLSSPSKPLNYGKLADIEQEEKEAPGKFLGSLREALRRITEIDPESEEGKVILKDRFLTRSAPDIRGKLLKWAYGPNQSLDTLLQLAQTVYYGREYEEKKER